LSGAIVQVGGIHRSTVSMRWRQVGLHHTTRMHNTST